MSSLLPSSNSFLFSATYLGDNMFGNAVGRSSTYERIVKYGIAMVVSLTVSKYMHEWAKK